MPAPLATHRPRSEAQRLASRRNGARSRGPVSAEGKARAAMNALRHGLASPTTVVAPGEDPEAFAALLADLRAEHAPADTTEDLLVQRLAATLWKLARCDRLEAELAGCRPRPPVGRIYPDGTPVLLTRAGELAALSAHAARLERAMHRLLRALAARPPRTARDVEAQPEAPAAGLPGGPAIRPNEPDRRPTAGAPPGGPAAPRPAAAAAPPTVPVENRANEPGPDPEAALLGRARAEPDLALALAEGLAAEGELARLGRLLRDRRPPPSPPPGSEPAAPGARAPAGVEGLTPAAVPDTRIPDRAW